MVLKSCCVLQDH